MNITKMESSPLIQFEVQSPEHNDVEMRSISSNNSEENQFQNGIFIQY